MGYTLSKERAEALFAKLKEKYQIIAPKRFPKQGRYSDTDIIRYDQIQSPDEIEYRRKSTFPMKEALNPIQQSLFFYTEDEYREARKNLKPMLIFGRACDINAQKIQERIYLQNGNFEDAYYRRRHELARFVLMECEESTDTCFCVSMNSNKTEDYAFAVRFHEDGMDIEVKDPEFEAWFADQEPSDYHVRFIESNELSVKPPVIKDRETLIALKNHPMWKEYDKRCISCGSCTIACSTCTCFTTRDIVYTENGEAGERRRVSASCQVAGFDQMAGQKEIRNTAGARTRYKALHKFHDYDARFHEGHMCVGCGRCIDRCPEFISNAAIVNKMSDAIDEIQAEKAGEEALYAR